MAASVVSAVNWLGRNDLDHVHINMAASHEDMVAHTDDGGGRKDHMPGQPTKQSWVKKNATWLDVNYLANNSLGVVGVQHLFLLPKDLETS